MKGQHHGSSRGLLKHHRSSRGLLKHHRSSTGLLRHHRSSRGLLRHHKSSRGLLRHHRSSRGLLRHHRSSRGPLRHHRSSKGLLSLDYRLFLWICFPLVWFYLLCYRFLTFTWFMFVSLWSFMYFLSLLFYLVRKCSCPIHLYFLPYSWRSEHFTCDVYCVKSMIIGIFMYRSLIIK